MDDDGSNEEKRVTPGDGTGDGTTGDDSDTGNDTDTGDDDTGNGTETGDDAAGSDGTGDGTTGGENGNTDSDTGDSENGNTDSGDTGNANQNDNGSDAGNSENSSDASDSARTVGSVWQKFVSEGGEDSAYEDGGGTEPYTDNGGAGDGTDNSGTDTDVYYILSFHYETDLQEATATYQVSDTYVISDEPGTIRPYDAYSTGSTVESDGTEAAVQEVSEDDGAVRTQAIDTQATSAAQATFEYVGSGKGNYRLTKSASSSSGYSIAVVGAPVYFRCTSVDWLRKYVFSSLAKGDNESDEFCVEVRVISADELTGADVEDADLVFLDGDDFLPEGVTRKYIQKDYTNADLTDEAAYALIMRAVDDLLPVIVDYDIVKDKDNYKDSQYQKTAKVFRKQDLTDFYYEMDGQLKDMLLNLDKDNKDDNSYHYVNKNIYFINDRLVTSEFNKELDKDEAEAGFSEIKSAIAMENLTIQDDDDKLSDEITKAKAVQYIINYAVGLVGDYKDLTILELQPGSNPESDFRLDVDSEKNSAVLYWKKADSDQAGQQILRSSKAISATVDTKSVEEFNGELEDINDIYDMVFIGLDGQTLNRDGENQKTVYNKEELNGKLYHTGDSVSGMGAQYDYSDITEQKKEALLAYLQAGYPVVVENDFFTKGTAKDAKGNEIDTDYISSDTRLYEFLKTAKEEYGDYLYTVSDVRGNAFFRAQLNVIRPKLTYVDGEQTADETSSDTGGHILTADLNEEGIMQAAISYAVSNDRGEAYYGDLSTRLYLDMNLDGVYTDAEELQEYTVAYDGANGQITVQFEGILSGLIPWKLEISDAGNRYRRSSIEGYFEIINSQTPMPVSILQVTNSKGSDSADLQRMYSELDNSMLGYYIKGAESLTNTAFDIKTVTVDELAAALSENADYLNRWDILVLGFGEEDMSLGGAAEAVRAYIDEGRSVLMSSAGANGSQLDLAASTLGQSEDQTYTSLGSQSGSYYRYAGLDSSMFGAQAGLFAEVVNAGSISAYPYDVGLVGVDLTASVNAPTYLLDLDSNTDENDGAYVTAWYTLSKPENAVNAYTVSLRDARNNYYIYSKGNVVYIGQKDYPYSYDKADDTSVFGDGASECKLFVNALMTAYEAGVHSSQVSIVAGFQSTAASIESISIPFDEVLRDEGDADAGILDETVDVYFRFADNNLSFKKEQTVRFYYEDPSGAPVDIGGETVTATEFASSIDTVEENRLVSVSGDQLKQQQVYRIKAPVVALKNDSGAVNADIYVVVETKFRRGGKEYSVLSSDSVSLNRAQLFLLE
jgi:hypothetical protein